MTTKIACERCSREIALGRIAVHQKSSKCIPTAGAQPAAGTLASPAPTPAPTPAPVAGDVRGFIWACRDDLRLVGISGMEALECIVAVIALRRFGEIFPEMANPPEFFGDLSRRFDLFGGGVEAIINRRATFTQLLTHPNDDGSKNNDGTPVGKAKMIRDAFVALKALPAAAAHGQFFAGDKASMLATFPCEDDAAAGKLLRRIAAGIAYDPSADTIGRAIQSVTKDFAADAKDLGQFFTPPPIIDVAMSRALAAYRDGAVVMAADTAAGAATAATGAAAGAVAARPLGRVLDPTCGSGTFLLRADAAGAAAIAGVELSKIVHRLALTNLVVGCRTPPPPAAIVCGDVLTKPLPGENVTTPGSARFDTVLANPPYGIKGVKHDSLVAALGAAGPRVYPLKTTATGFFIQRIVAALAIGGRGVVVLPNGNELSKSDPASVIFRKALCHALDVLEIISVPAGVFENTGIATIILVFEKRHELADVVVRVGGRGTTTIALACEPATARVALSRLVVGADGAASTAPVDGAPAFVAAAELSAAGWALAPGAYRAAPPPPIASAYPMVRLGELITLVKGSVQASKVVPGQFPVITMASGKTHSVATDDGTVLAIAVVSPVGRIYFHEGKCAIADILCRLVPISGTAAARYDVRYLYHTLDMLSSHIRTHCEKGLANKTLDKKLFDQVIIPLPPVELQRAIAAALDVADAEATTLEAAADILDRVRTMEMYNKLYAHKCLAPITGNWTPAPGVEVRPLGDVASFKTGSSLSKKNMEPGQIPVLGGGIGIIAFHSSANCPAGRTLVSRMGSAGTVSRTTTGSFVTESAFILSWTFAVIPEFGYHLLKISEPALIGIRRGMIPAINQQTLSKFQVAIPPLDVQARLAAELDSNYAEAASLRKRAADTRATARNAVGVVLSSGPFTAPTNYDFADGAADLVDDDANVDDVDDADDGTDTGADAAAANAADVDC